MTNSSVSCKTKKKRNKEEKKEKLFLFSLSPRNGFGNRDC